jgi:hypothetical protein
MMYGRVKIKSNIDINTISGNLVNQQTIPQLSQTEKCSTIIHVCNGEPRHGAVGVG